MSRSPHRGPKSRSQATESAQAEHVGPVDVSSPGWVLSAIISEEMVRLPPPLEDMGSPCHLTLPRM